MNDIFKENITVKIISLLIAIILWAYVVSDQNPKIIHQIKDVPVTLKNVEMLEEYGLVIEGDQEYKVNIRVKGRRNDIYALKSTDIEAFADLAGHTKKGVNVIPVQVVGALDKFEDVTLDPLNINVYLDEIIKKQIPVEVKYKGKLQDGYVKGVPKIRPSEIIVTGPSKSITKIESAVVELDLKGVSENIETALPIKLYDKQEKEILDDVNIAPSKTVDVKLPVIPTKEVKVEADFQGSLKDGYEIDKVVVQPSTVRIAGNGQVLDGIDFIKALPINLEGRSDDFSVTVKPVVPDNVFLVDEEETVTITVSVKEKEIERDFETDRIEYRNLGDNLEIVQGGQVKIKVIVLGKQSEVDSIMPDDIKLFVDLGGLEAGVHRNLKVNIDAIPRVQILNINPEAINIELAEETE